jgi:proteic killer suppression protein
MIITEVEIEAKAEKELRKLPYYIKENFWDWLYDVQRYGIQKIRLVPGYHDEALQGIWFGYRSVRLNHSYRIIYKQITRENIKIIVIRISKHDYK